MAPWHGVDTEYYEMHAFCDNNMTDKSQALEFPK